jgi:hypothetical protein
MKKNIQNLLLFSCLFLSNQSTAQNVNSHKYQIGLESGFGVITTGSLTFGPSFGAFYRYENLTIGGRRDYFKEFKIFGDSKHYQSINLYFGYTEEKKNYYLTPQIGFGFFETNYTASLPKHDGFAVEISLAMNTHIKGTGIGFRAFYNYNNMVNYFGVVANFTLGWAWNKSKKSK